MKHKTKKVPIVLVYVSGGNVQGARSNVKRVAVEIFDVDNKKAEGKNDDQIEAEWQDRIQTIKHAIY